jgi:hypothetical protein
MIAWRVEIASDGGRPIVTLEGEGSAAWQALPPHDIVRVTLLIGSYRRILCGMDRYWMKGNQYGNFVDETNRDWYEGAHAVAFEWDPLLLRERKIEDALPPEGAHVLAGAMIPDDLAVEIGLLSPGEALPPRPG